MAPHPRRLHRYYGRVEEIDRDRVRPGELAGVLIARRYSAVFTLRPQLHPSNLLANGAKRTKGSLVAIAVVVEFPGATAEQYDQVIAKLGLTPGGAAMPGQLSDWVSVTDEGTRITDVWESRQTFEKFAEEKMVPAVTEVGVPGPPNISFHDVYNYFTEGPKAS